MAMCIAPMLSYTAATRFVCLVMAAFMKELQIPIDSKGIANIVPNEKALFKFIKELAVDVLTKTRMQIRTVKKLYLSMDAANKNGMHHMVKIISYWDFDADVLEIFTLDSDACDGTNVAAAKAVDYFLQKVDPVNAPKINLCGVSTDAGGGGVSIGLVQELRLLNRVNPNHFVYITCALHALNLMFNNPVVKFVGVGGVKNKNALQLLFTAHALENEFEISTFKSLWLEINKVKYGNKLTKPVLTRWEFVGLSTVEFLNRYEGFKKMGEYIHKKGNNGFRKKAIDIAKDMMELLSSAAIITMLHFMNGFYIDFWKHHFHSLKKKMILLNNQAICLG